MARSRFEFLASDAEIKLHRYQYTRTCGGLCGLDILEKIYKVWLFHLRTLSGNVKQCERNSRFFVILLSPIVRLDIEVTDMR